MLLLGPVMDLDRRRNDVTENDLDEMGILIAQHDLVYLGRYAAFSILRRDQSLPQFAAKPRGPGRACRVPPKAVS